MRSVWAIASLEIKECLRSKIIYVIGALMLLFILLGRGCNAGNTTVNATLISEDVRQNLSLALAEVDWASFDPLWHNSQETLRQALAQSMFAMVAEDDRGIVGYQVTTGSGGRAHLARLAVHPSMQGRGVGKALLGDLFGRLVQNGYLKLSVNTQSDNQTSLKLYQRMGFVRTGDAYPVYTFDVPAY